MTNKKQKLELTWIGKDEELKLEPRILIEDPNKSYGDPSSENMLIHGDNLLALKSLEQEYTNKIKSIFIDPPYNTGSAFKQYDDNLEHSIWLTLMKPRLELLFRLLSENGSIWISIDDNECHYLKVLCDEIFGRQNFLANIVWQSKDTPGNNSAGIAQTHNHILGYRKSEKFMPNMLIRNEKQLATYSNPDNDSRGPWLATPLTRVEFRERDYYAISNLVGTPVLPPRGSSWRRPPNKMKELQADNRIWWGKNGDSNFPMEKKFLSEVKEGVVNQTWWPYDFAGSTRNASAEMKKIFSGQKSFDTPKPEKLIKRILDLSSQPNDFVLDSFLGSGTTSAVAHKMGRKWIGIELGEHANSHCLPRLKKVVDGADGLPLSEALGWKGGGGFKFYNLAPSLLRKDSFGNSVIDEKYNANMLAAAMCKHEGFKYSPDEASYWKQGKSTETDYIFVTTGFVTVEQLDAIHAQMTENESLLICAKSFAPESENHFSNITIKKIPQMILGKCEFGKDNYDLNIIKAIKDEAEESEEVQDEQ